MRYLLDTAPWINAVTMPRVIPERVLGLLAGDKPTGLCSVSLLEKAHLHRLGRFRLQGTLGQFFAVAIADNLRLLGLTPSVAAKTNNLSAGFQRDPFDRTIVATAAVLKLTLITADAATRDADQCAVEYCPFRTR